MKKIHVVFIGQKHDINEFTEGNFASICKVERWKIRSYRRVGQDGLWSIEVPENIDEDDVEVAFRLRGMMHVYVVQDEDLWFYE